MYPRFIPAKKPEQVHNAHPVEEKPEQTPVQQDVTMESPEPTKKPKKEKKRKRTSEDQAPPPDADSDKHKAVFSKFEQATRKSQKEQELRDQQSASEDDLDEKSSPILRDLEPLPQPAIVPDAPFEQKESDLPRWLAQPVLVDASASVPFGELGVHSKFVRKLKDQGITAALPVQSVLLPMILPGYKQHQGDICVSARTGSGKTLAYLLPIIQALGEPLTPTLSAVVIVPKRQLVNQALQIAQELCAGTKIKVGTAVGEVPFATEQKELLTLRPRYDPQRAAEIRKTAAEQFKTGFVENCAFIEDFLRGPKDHVPHYDFNVDILICTPGRLVEHIQSTTGFLLRDVKWVVMDEGDQLLDEDFQGWAPILMDALHGETPEHLMNARERLFKQIRQSNPFIPHHRGLTKVVLSATLRKELSKLNSLKLRRPKLVAANEGEGFELPSTLDEFAVPVGDGQKKPLYALYLLLYHVFGVPKQDGATDEEALKAAIAQTVSQHTNKVLVFTRSNENASRLSHLLSTLEPALSDHSKALTPSLSAKARKKMLRAFGTGSIKILIASDAASRGLDVSDITHVVNYDLPTSDDSYVHRVGRTARVDKNGEAWTFFTKSEAAWFWNQLARGEGIQRGDKKVKRVEWKEWDVTFNRKKTYDAALAELEGAVKGESSAK